MTEKEFYNLHHINAYVPAHPYASKSGQMLAHRLEAEEDIGRWLLPSEEVHHHYFSKGGYVLAICKNRTEHAEMHKLEEAFRYSGHYDWHKCTYCKQYDAPENLSINWSTYHKGCKNKYYAERKQL